MHRCCLQRLLGKKEQNLYQGLSENPSATMHYMRWEIEGMPLNELTDRQADGACKQVLSEISATFSNLEKTEKQERPEDRRFRRHYLSCPLSQKML